MKRGRPTTPSASPHIAYTEQERSKRLSKSVEESTGNNQTTLRIYRYDNSEAEDHMFCTQIMYRILFHYGYYAHLMSAYVARGLPIPPTEKQEHMSEEAFAADCLVARNIAKLIAQSIGYEPDAKDATQEQRESMIQVISHSLCDENLMSFNHIIIFQQIYSNQGLRDLLRKHDDPALFDTFYKNICTLFDGDVVFLNNINKHNKYPEIVKIAANVATAYVTGYKL